METLEELKAIIDNAPEGAQFFDGRYFKFDGDYIQICINKDREWFYIDANEIRLPRSLSDIKRIIELMEIVEDAASLGFLTPSFDSGVSHKQLCKKYEAMKL